MHVVQSWKEAHYWIRITFVHLNVYGMYRYMRSGTLLKICVCYFSEWHWQLSLLDNRGDIAFMGHFAKWAYEKNNAFVRISVHTLTYYTKNYVYIWLYDKYYFMKCLLYSHSMLRVQLQSNIKCAIHMMCTWSSTYQYECMIVSSIIWIRDITCYAIIVINSIVSHVFLPKQYSTVHSILISQYR